MEHNLTALPHMEEHAHNLSSLKVTAAARATPSTAVAAAASQFVPTKRPPASHQVNQSLAKIYVHVQAYRLYVGWLKEGQQNASLPSDAARGANARLLYLSDLLTSSLQQVRRPKTTHNPLSVWR